ncbi:MAG: hypothetical protein IT207_11140 [Fimbriimonadaceae bacterium]|nr:hypothetical protein [Fimbriimonadaceae bacterium]
MRHNSICGGIETATMRNTPQKPWWHGVLWGAFIWLLVPAILFTLGYNVIGPRVGTVPALNAKVDDLARRLGGSEAKVEPDPVTDSEPAQAGVPQVEVEVTPSKAEESEDEPAPRRRARPRREPEKPKPEEPKAEPETPRDEAGGGTQTPPPEPEVEQPPTETPPPTTGGDGGGL